MLAAADNHLGASRTRLSAAFLPRRRERKHGRMPATALAAFVIGGGGRGFPPLDFVVGRISGTKPEAFN